MGSQQLLNKQLQLISIAAITNYMFLGTVD